MAFPRVHVYAKFRSVAYEQLLFLLTVVNLLYLPPTREYVLVSYHSMPLLVVQLVSSNRAHTLQNSAVHFHKQIDHLDNREHSDSDKRIEKRVVITEPSLMTLSYDADLTDNLLQHHPLLAAPVRKGRRIIRFRFLKSLVHAKKHL